MFTQSQIENIVDLLYTLDSNTKIYLGCDSVRYRKIMLGLPVMQL